MDTPKGFNIHPKSHKTAQDIKYFSNPLPWRTYKSRVKPRQNRRPKWARGRAADLALARVEPKQLPTISRRRSEPLSEGRWPCGEIPRLAGLGVAGRPHLEASQAKVWRGS